MSDLTFLDLVVLERIDENSTVERFGSAINTSFFEAANLLGTLKVKGYVDIQPSVGGISRIALTEAGASILQNAAGKTDEPVDALDNGIMKTLASGVRELEALEEALNIRSSDLAYHLYKLNRQEYIHYDIRSAKVGISLTEKGFNVTGGYRAVEQHEKSEAEKEAHDIMAPSPPPSAAPPAAQKGTAAGPQWAEMPAKPQELSKPAAPKESEPQAPPWVKITDIFKQKAAAPAAKPAPAAPQPAQATSVSVAAPAAEQATKSDMALSKYGYYAQKYALVIVFGILLGLVAGWYFFLQGKI